MKRSQFLGVAGGTLLSLGAGGVALYGAGYRPIRQESQYLASGPEFASLGELARASSLVVRAAVVEAGAPYHVPFDPAVVVAGLFGGQLDTGRLTPLDGDGGPRGLLQAAGLLFFAFAGYARIATLGEEVTDPSRTIRARSPRPSASRSASTPSWR